MTPPIRSLVPMLHVADIERSIEFYRRLGFEIGNRVPPEGVPGWVWLFAKHAADWKRGPNLMLTCSDGPISAEAQGVLFYLYAENLQSLRKELLESGVQVGEICYPEYLPQGEFRATDPDGYTLMIAQSTQETP